MFPINVLQTVSCTLTTKITRGSTFWLVHPKQQVTVPLKGTDDIHLGAWLTYGADSLE